MFGTTIKVSLWFIETPAVFRFRRLDHVAFHRAALT